MRIKVMSGALHSKDKWFIYKMLESGETRRETNNRYNCVYELENKSDGLLNYIEVTITETFRQTEIVTKAIILVS